ncbi:hypothetical protein HY546_00360 [archaeon]|nr:hypothetical protein [archaeon]
MEQRPWPHRAAEHCVRIAGTGAEICLEPIRRRYHRHYYGRRHHLIADLLLGGTVIILAVLIGYLWIAPIFFRPLVNFSLSASAEIVSLGTNEFKVRYKNTGQDALENVQVVLHPPEALLMETALTVNLGNLPRGGAGELAFRGRLLGTLENSQFRAEKLVLDTTYNRRGKNRQELSEILLQPKRSLLTVEFSEASTLVGGTPQTWTAKISNTSAYEYMVAGEWRTPKSMKLSAPSSFSLTLAPGKTETVHLTGTMPEPLIAEAREQIVLSIGVKYGETVFPQAISQQTVKVIRSKVRVQLSLEDNPVSVRPGEALNFRVSYRNEESEPIEQVRLKTDLPPEFFVLGTLSSTEARREGEQLVWTGESLPALRRLEAGSFGEVKFTVRLKRPLVLASHATRINLPAQVGLQYVLPSKSEEALQVRGALPPVLLETVVNVEAAARYFAFGGEQLGRGPLPPRVGRTTSYWIYLKLTKPSNAVSEGVLTLRLAPGVRWIDRASAKEPLNFDAASQTVRWQTGTVPAWTGYNSPALEAAFEVMFTPAASQAGQVPPLILDPLFTGQDTETRQAIKILSVPLTTNLTSDIIAAGKGMVRP